MKRILANVIMVFVLCHVSAFIIALKKFGLAFYANSIALDAHFEISIYALECSIPVIVVDLITKNWYIKKGDRFIWVGPGGEKEKKK